MSLQLFSIESDIAGGKLGSSKGVSMLREYLLQNRYCHFSKSHILRLDSNLHSDTSYAKHINTLYSFFTKVAQRSESIHKANDIAFILSGDHGSALAAVQGMQNASSDDIGLIWIDAHSDIHTPYSTFSGNLHGMPVSALIGARLDSKNIPTTSERLLWDRLCNISKDSIKPSNIVYCGIRSYESAEVDLIESKNIQVLSIERLKANMPHCVDIIKEQLAHVKKVYVSIDIDVLDSAIFSSTGCNEPNGLTMSELKDLVRLIIESINRKIIAIELSEFNPTLDISRDSDFESIKGLLDVMIGVSG